MQQAPCRPHLALVVVGALLATLVSSGVVLAFEPSGLLEIHYINVQQGSSVLVIGPDGTTVLMDAGRSGKGASEVVPYLELLGLDPENDLDYTLTGHLDNDHVGGMDEILMAYKVQKGNWFNGSPKQGPFVQDYRFAAMLTPAGEPTSIFPGDTLALGDGATLTVVAANGEILDVDGLPHPRKENDRSVAVLVEYGDFDYLWSGDLEGGDHDTACTGRSADGSLDYETPLAEGLLAAGLVSAEGVDVLHVNHHGSETSTNSRWMNLLRPEVAIISVGAGQGGNFHHPRKAVVENVLLAEAEACITAPPVRWVLQTEEGSPVGTKTSFEGFAVGDIRITTDGIHDYSVDATGLVSQGPDERAAAGLPVVLPLDEGEGTDDECVPGAETLCLEEGRFRVTAHWATSQGTEGEGQAERLTDDTGYFWFFDRDNVEVVVKVLPGCPVNGHFWFFAGGLTNVEMEIRVTDTEHGQTNFYRNPLNTPFQPVQDVRAFTTCGGDGNLPPTADFEATCRGFRCDFFDRSQDPDGFLESWSWQFGDGFFSPVRDPRHTYPGQGTYPVSLEVTDDEGATDTASQAVHLSCLQAVQCCRICSVGKPCGDSCIAASSTCQQSLGCACDETEVCP